MFQIIFYTRENGTAPAMVFLESLGVKEKARVSSDISILRELGNSLHEPKSKYIGDGIFELRSKFKDGIGRIFYFFRKGNTIVLTKGFIKKSVRTPGKELERARRYKADYERRYPDEDV